MEDENNLEEQTSTTVTTEESSETASVVNLVELLGITEIPVSIPIEFLFVYNKLLLVMIELGESMLLDCKALCSSRNMPIVECYHMFKAALAAKQLAFASTDDEDNTISNYYEKLANTLLNYVKEQLNCITRNYSDDLSFVLPLGTNGLVNLFITKNNVNTEIIVKGSDVELAEAYLGMTRDPIDGVVVTEDSENTYDLTEEELSAHKHWHVIEGKEFLPGSSAVYINGVRYFLHINYEEWTVTENGTSKGVGIILTNMSFDVADSPDHVYVEAKLLPTVSE